MAWHAAGSSGDPQATVERFPYLIAFERHKDHALVLGVHIRSGGPFTGTLGQAKGVRVLKAGGTVEPSVPRLLFARHTATYVSA